MKPVYVFKTSVATHAEAIKLKPLLDGLIQRDERWNFDLDDCDHILRIESAACKATHVMEVLKIAGFDCEELQ